MARKLLVALGCFIALTFSIDTFSEPGFLSWFVSPTHSNCPQAVSASHPQFCQSFRAVAQCHCTESGLPAGMCRDMNTIYKRMLAVFGSQQKACAYQKDTQFQTCMDDWNCYLLGGRDSLGNLCSTTGKRCT
ncbi:MAG: hypothetical protein H0W64_10335 [Gammaproteobacteria bacterium]|nr:hypothetical protein [Gammaproteobacteria bacterium]